VQHVAAWCALLQAEWLYAGGVWLGPWGTPA